MTDDAESDSDVERILEAVASVAADVPAELPRLREYPESSADVRDTDDAADERNPTGDDQSPADRWLDDRFREALASLEAVGAYASEERADVLDCGDGYGVAIDPLDGSDNLASNNPVGAVLGIYDAELPARGTALVASAIVVFGPCVTMTVATGRPDEAADDERVVQYRVDERDGERTDPRPLSLSGGSDTDDGDGEESDDVTTEICGFSGRRSDIPSGLLEALDDVRAERRLRYAGAAVADVGALLEDGGLLCYPATEHRSAGVLRLQYEANPIAHLVEAAGGRAIAGPDERLLEREPTDLHERVPVFVGSPAPLERIESAL